jgi:hypothetical protein
VASASHAVLRAQDTGEVGAQQRLLRVRDRARRPQLPARATLRGGQERHHQQRHRGKHDPDRRVFRRFRAEQRPHRLDRDVGASAKNDTAITFNAVRSRASGSSPENCHATAAAEATSITESSPNPISAVDDATEPAESATTASTTL